MTRPGLPIPAASTSPAGRTGTPRSARVFTRAWEPRWPGSRRRRRGTLAAQFPRFDIAEDTLRYVPNIVSRSLRGLHVTFRDQ